MAIFTGILSIAILVVGGSIHIYLIRKDEIKPPPAAWLPFALGMSVSYGLYWMSENPSFWGNPGQFIAWVEILAVTGTLWFTLWQRGELTWQSLKQLEPDQKWVIRLSLLTLGVWFVAWTFGIGDAATVAKYTFIASQLLMVGGYVGTVLRFLRLKENKDSLAAWFCIFLSSLFALFPAWEKQDMLSMINAVRATVFAAGTFMFLLGLDAANGRFDNNTRD